MPFECPRNSIAIEYPPIKREVAGIEVLPGAPLFSSPESVAPDSRDEPNIAGIAAMSGTVTLSASPRLNRNARLEGLGL
jgi:hypothetical protein